ncbi:Vitellogenin-1 [Gossypium arboreum]|uniref:Vitellogenin-1 n=1 Tax=Gossypium arboreum TaxID=29729 RepID=A0A0B0P0B3_GOSAR|nr:Vitellogenin-1 [Gossypium arboreum]
MPVSLARMPFEVDTHARMLGRYVPFRGYTDLCHTTSHTPVCEAVWSIMTSNNFHTRGHTAV